MAVVAWTTQEASPTAALTMVPKGSLSTGDTYTFANDGRTVLVCRKSGATDCTVTVVSPATVGGLAVADLTFTVPATTGYVMSPLLRPDIYNDPATGLVTVSFSNITGLDVVPVRLPL